ncbi:hypothetical protein [Sporosarcina sp. FSL W7-1283]|uniref:hypothetical protein n=1 Tax=Sporosarcina sp. FSL W7-1283 TaxID=2921560 RepID=UPI0030FD1D8B
MAEQEIQKNNLNGLVKAVREGKIDMQVAKKLLLQHGTPNSEIDEAFANFKQNSKPKSNAGAIKFIDRVTKAVESNLSKSREKRIAEERKDMEIQARRNDYLKKYYEKLY